MVTQWAPHPTSTGQAMALGERIRTLRKERSWSQGDLGERIGADAGQISRYENDKITPSADVVVKLAQALDVSCDHLLVDTAPRRPFNAPENALGDNLAALDELSDDDRAALLNHLDALVTRTRLRTLANTGTG